MSDGETVIDLTLNLRNYTRNVDSAMRSAMKATDAIEDLEDSASDAEVTLNRLGKGVKVTIKVNDAELRTAAGDISDLDSETITVPISATYSELLDAEETVARIDAETPSVTVSAADTALQGILTTLQNIDSKTVSPNIDVDQNGKQDILEVRDTLSRIQQMARINLIVSGARAAKNAIAGIADLPLVSTMAELNAAMRVFQSLTGEPPTGAMREIIQGEFSRGIAETPDEVARLAAQLERANLGGADLSDSLAAVYNFARVSGQPVDALASAAQKMVANNLASNVTEAMDLLTTGFQGGANGANDLVETIDEFAPHFAGAGLSGAQSIELINQALLAGAQNGSRAGDVFKEVALILDAQLAEGAGAAVDALNAIDPTGQLGLMDTAELVATGEESGAVLAAGVMDGIAAGLEAGTINPVDVDSMLTAIFGTPVEELGSEVFKDIDFSAVVAAQFSEGATAEAVEPLRGGLVAAAQELGRVLEFEVAEKFRIAGQPLQDLLDNAPQKMRDLAELIRNGEGIPEALEIVLQAPGLADTIHDFESGFSNLIIGFIDALAKLIAVIPGANPAPLQATVANLATGQLPFDLMNADTMAEMESAIRTAWERGVTVEGFEASVAEAAETLKDDGQLIAAETLLTRAEAIAKTIQGSSSEWSNSIGPIVLASGGETTPGFDTAQFTEAAEIVEDARLGFDDYATTVRKAGDDAAAASVRATPLSLLISKMGDEATITKGPTEALGDTVKDLGLAVEDTGAEFSIMSESTVEGLGGLVTAVETESPKLLEDWAGWRDMLIEVGNAAFEAYTNATALFGATGGGYTPGNTAPIGPRKGLASGGIPSVQTPTLVGEQGHEWASFAAGASILNNQTTDAIIGGLAALLSGGYGVGGSNVYNVNAPVVINTQGNAAALGAGERVGKAMRGFIG